MREGNFTKTALSMLIEHLRRDAGTLKQLHHEMRLG